VPKISLSSLFRDFLWRGVKKAQQWSLVAWDKVFLPRLAWDKVFLPRLAWDKDYSLLA